jgi:hypothetical protein
VKVTIIWGVTEHGLVEVHRCFRGTSHGRDQQEEEEEKARHVVSLMKRTHPFG